MVMKFVAFLLILVVVLKLKVEAGRVMDSLRQTLKYLNAPFRFSPRNTTKRFASKLNIAKDLQFPSFLSPRDRVNSFSFGLFGSIAVPKIHLRERKEKGEGLTREDVQQSQLFELAAQLIDPSTQLFFRILNI